MSEPIGGYIFIPITLHTSVSEVAHQACEGLTPSWWRRGDEIQGHFEPISPDQLAREAQQSGSVTFAAPLSDIRTYFSIRKPYTTSIGVKYYEIDVTAYPGSFESWYPDAGYTPERMDAFAQQWADLCERVGAEFGYFSSRLSVWEEIRDDILSRLEQMNTSYFTASYWLSYWGPRLVALLPVPETAKEDFQMQHMPSGAVVVRSGRGPFSIERDGVRTRW